MLIPAFTRVFQDTFPQAKIAGILALAATQQYYLLSEVATRILPALCTLTVDPDKSVRDSAFKTIKGFLGKLEKASEDPSLREKFGMSYVNTYLQWCPRQPLRTVIQFINFVKHIYTEADVDAASSSGVAEAGETLHTIIA